MTTLPPTPPPSPTPLNQTVLTSTPQRRRARRLTVAAAPQASRQRRIEQRASDSFNNCFIRVCTYLFGRDGRGK